MRLKDAIYISEHYDFILIDLSPSLGIRVISLVNLVLVPIQTQFKAFQGTDSLHTRGLLL